jgi:thiol-disulfide isomerase/thioredoxin
MKKSHGAKSVLYAMVLTLAAQSMAHAGEPAGAGDKLRFDTQKPRAGQTISFGYSATGGKLAGVQDIHAALFYYTAAKVTGYYAQDITISPAGKDNWKGSFVLPDSAVAFAVRLKSGKLVENNNGQGFISLVYNDGVVKQGSYAGAALLFVNGEQLLNLSGKADTAMALLEKEFSIHPQLRSTYEAAWYYALAKAKKQEAYPLLEKRAQELLASPHAAAADYKLAMRLFQLQGKKKTADSLLRAGAEKFPGSELAVQYDDNRFYAIRDVDSMILYYHDFNRTYAGAGPKDAATQASSWFAATIAAKYINKKDYRKAVEYTALVKDVLADYRAYTYNWIAMNASNDNALPLADSIIRVALSGLDQALAHPEASRSDDIPVSEWKDNINMYYYSGVADTYGKILFQEKAYQPSLAMQQKAVALSNGKNNGYNERYVKYLYTAGEIKKAREISEGFIKESKASDSVKTWLREAYIKEKGAAQGFDSYLAGLEAVGLATFREEAIKEKLDIPSRAFAMKDMDGKEISLASLKGKVVIIDFWATWCGPCKASFPAMQTAVNKFKNDTNVVFLFVNTLESYPAQQRLSEVGKFISDHQYTFHVVLDNVVDLEKRQYSVVSDYGVGGIPTKFVIDPQGKIAFKSVGFDGNNEKLVNELSVYIDIAKGH